MAKRPERVRVDPRIHVRVIPDGEVHIVFDMDEHTLFEFARAYVAMSEGRLNPEDAQLAFRVKTADALDYLIEQLLDARKKAWPGEKR